MNSQSPITSIEESLLIRKAAKLRKLTLSNKPRMDTCYPQFDSEPVGTFNLDTAFIIALNRHGFTFDTGTKPPHDEMQYLNGHSDQQGAEMFESDCWAWKRTETYPQLDVRFRLRVSEEKRGIVCEPHVWGNCAGGACHQPTIDKFMKVVSEHFSDLHPLITRATDVETPPIIYWSEIGLGGIKSVGRLFDELFEKNKKVIELAHSALSPFEPDPQQQASIINPKDRIFVPEDYQPQLFRQWKEQLWLLRTSLV